MNVPILIHIKYKFKNYFNKMLNLSYHIKLFQLGMILEGLSWSEKLNISLNLAQ